MGYFEFRICANNNPDQYVDQSCLDQNLLELADGSGTRYTIDDPVSVYKNRLWFLSIILYNWYVSLTLIMLFAIFKWSIIKF